MTIKLKSIKADLKREFTGDWIEYPDWPGVAFNVSSLLLPAYRIERELLGQRLSRQFKGKTIPPEVATTEVGKLYAKHILHNWRGFDVPYSQDVANEMLPDPEYRNLVAAIEWCAAKVSDVDVEFIEDAAKKLRKAFRSRLRREGLPEGQQDWLEDLAAEEGAEDWVIKAAYPDGRIEFEPELWHGLYWEAWNALRFDRQYGAYGGQTPIPYLVIRAYAQDHNIVGEDLLLFRSFMTAIDAEWLAFVTERDKKEKGGKADG